jgi:hypothetical protein
MRASSMNFSSLNFEASIHASLHQLVHLGLTVRTNYDARTATSGKLSSAADIATHLNHFDVL